MQVVNFKLNVKNRIIYNTQKQTKCYKSRQINIVLPSSAELRVFYIYEKNWLFLGFGLCLICNIWEYLLELYFLLK